MRRRNTRAKHAFFHHHKHLSSIGVRAAAECMNDADVVLSFDRNDDDGAHEMPYVLTRPKANKRESVEFQKRS